MNAASLTVLAFSMSMDAFAAALGRGAALRRPRAREAIRTGLVFGLVEAAAPVVGWTIGAAPAAWLTLGAATAASIMAVDHWLAFAILGLTGLRMCCLAWWGVTEKQATLNQSLGLLVIVALATSIDAMTVGVSLAFVDVNIVLAAGAVGLTTCFMAMIGTFAGRWLGPGYGRSAEFVGGLGLIGIGTKILIEHTFA